MIGLTAGSELPIHDSAGVKRLGLRVLSDLDIQLVRYNSSGVEQEEILSIDSSTGIVTIGSANIDLPANSIATADITDAAVTPVKLGGTVVTTANDGTPVITAALSVLEFQKTANTTTAITMTATHAGHFVVLKMLVGDADSVYTAAVAGGTITFNAAEEAAGVYYDGTEWRHAWLTGATFA